MSLLFLFLAVGLFLQQSGSLHATGEGTIYVDGDKDLAVFNSVRMSFLIFLKDFTPSVSILTYP